MPVIPYTTQMPMAPLCAHCEKQQQNARYMPLWGSYSSRHVYAKSLMSPAWNQILGEHYVDELSNLTSSLYSVILIVTIHS
jgi:hypothetical protein